MALAPSMEADDKPIDYRAVKKTATETGSRHGARQTLRSIFGTFAGVSLCHLL